MVENNWISVKDELPFREYESDAFGICDRVLVTVYPKEPDKNDDPEIMILYYSTKNNCFSYEPGGKNYDKVNESWKVVAWMPIPKPLDWEVYYEQYKLEKGV